MPKPPPIPILDTHVHLWDLKRFRLPWLPKDGPLAGDHLVPDYLAAAEGLNIVGAIYMEVDVEASQKAEEAEAVLELCRRPDTPLLGMVIGGDPASDGFEKVVRRFHTDPLVKGVRRVMPKDGLLDPAFVRGIQLLGDLGLRFDLCVPSDALEDAARLVGECPNTRFVLDHCGNPNVRTKDIMPWRRGLDALAKHDNVVCKISGIVATAEPGKWTPDDLAPFVQGCVHAFGKRRIMFGSDWPVLTTTATLRSWVEALMTITTHWREAERLDLFHDNAVRYYHLLPKSGRSLNPPAAGKPSAKEE